MSKSSDGDLYISGGTNYFIISVPWVRRCKVDGTNLDCVELSEPSKGAKGSNDATAAPASSAEPSSSATPAPEPEPKK